MDAATTVKTSGLETLSPSLIRIPPPARGGLAFALREVTGPLPRTPDETSEDEYNPDPVSMSQFCAGTALVAKKTSMVLLSSFPVRWPPRICATQNWFRTSYNVGKLVDTLSLTINCRCGGISLLGMRRSTEAKECDL